MAGIFVLAGLIAIGILTVKVGSLTLLGQDTYSLFARFKTVAGLNSGNTIEMFGIEVGKVAGFTLDQDKQLAVAELKIRKGVKIYDDALASIKTSGLLGDKYISIDPGGGSDKLLRPGDFIIDTVHPMDLQDMIGKFAFGSVQEGKPDK